MKSEVSVHILSLDWLSTDKVDWYSKVFQEKVKINWKKVSAFFGKRPDYSVKKASGLFRNYSILLPLVSDFLDLSVFFNHFLSSGESTGS